MMMKIYVKRCLLILHADEDLRENTSELIYKLHRSPLYVLQDSRLCKEVNQLINFPLK